jgi:hypothetical protein
LYKEAETDDIVVETKGRVVQWIDVVAKEML